MRNRSKLLLVAIAAIAVLGMAVGAASARNFEISNSANGFRIAWNTLHLEAAGREVACSVTIEGNFERGTYAKVITTRTARVTEARLGTCTRNTATILRETLPWEVNYGSFTGTLPNIITIIHKGIKIPIKVNLEGIECLAQTRTEQPASGIATIGAGGAITGFTAEEAAGIETSGGFFCSVSGRAHFSGAASSITNRAGTAAITVRLI